MVDLQAWSIPAMLWSVSLESHSNEVMKQEMDETLKSAHTKNLY